MATDHEETLQQRYLREHDEYVARIESMTTDQIMALDVQLADVTAQRDQLQARVEVAEAGYQAAVQKAEWQARTNTELNALTLRIAKLTGSNDQLLAALQRYLDCDPTQSFGGDTPANQARAAIAAVKGGAA